MPLRTSMLAAAGALLLSSGAALADLPRGLAYADPAPQYISSTAPMSSSDRFRMEALRDRIIDRLPKDSVEIRIEPAYMLLRFPESALFSGPGDHVSPAGSALLTTLTEELLRQPANSIQVIGHRDSRGDGFASLIGSQRRANSVISVLHSRTLPSARLLAKGVGDRFPIDTNQTETGREANRRVEIVLRPR